MPLSRTVRIVPAPVYARLVSLAFPALLLATASLGCSSSSGTADAGPPTCQSTCASEPTCGEMVSECISDCQGLETACMMTGHTASLQSFLACKATASFTCDAGLPTTIDCQTQLTAVINDCLQGSGADASAE